MAFQAVSTGPMRSTSGSVSTQGEAAPTAGPSRARTLGKAGTAASTSQPATRSAGNPSTTARCASLDRPSLARRSRFVTGASPAKGPKISGQRSWRETPVTDSMGMAIAGARAPGAPIADSALANTKMGGKGCNPARGLHGSVECVHTGRITYRDPSRNTFRVSVASHTVKNLGMAFSDNLRAARLKAGMTQEALALACGWSGQSRIANYESSAASARARFRKYPC